ncbi:MAG: hypothetical protein ACKVWR_16270 [Acidimicrobiales bacterium]
MAAEQTVDVEFTAEESAALHKALLTYCSDLRMEIVDTDNPEYKRDLRSEREMLEGVLAKLDAAAEAGGRGAEARVVVGLVAVWTT